jgi:hypothetical protein
MKALHFGKGPPLKQSPCRTGSRTEELIISGEDIVSARADTGVSRLKYTIRNNEIMARIEITHFPTAEYRAVTVVCTDTETNGNEVVNTIKSVTDAGSEVSK